MHSCGWPDLRRVISEKVSVNIKRIKHVFFLLRPLQVALIVLAALLFAFCSQTLAGLSDIAILIIFKEFYVVFECKISAPLINKLILIFFALLFFVQILLYSIKRFNTSSIYIIAPLFACKI
jgi:hypothetical protein